MIRLDRTVAVFSFDAQATVAVGRERPEFLAVARLAADLARPIGARDVLDELLGPLPELLGSRVIERCVALGLLEPAGRRGEAQLSASGQLALEHGEVLVAEEGLWRFFFVDDPLVPGALLHAQRLEAEPVRRERAAAKEARQRGERTPRGEGPPDLLRDCCPSAPRQSVQSGHLFQVLEPPQRGATGPTAELRLSLTWAAQPALHLSGRLPSHSDDAPSKPIAADLPLSEVLGELGREQLWRQLVTHATGTAEHELQRWERRAGMPVVPVSFSALDDAARRAFRQDLQVPSIHLPELGTFEPTTLTEVNLVPASEADAQAWLGWLQWQSLADYVTPELLAREAAALRERFVHHRPSPLSAAELLARARAERNERSWFVLGPFDLGLWS